MFVYREIGIKMGSTVDCSKNIVSDSDFSWEEKERIKKNVI